MRRSWLAVLAILPGLGCSPFHSDDSGSSDAAIDAAIDAVPPPPPDAQQCFGTYLSICFNTAADIPTAPKILTSDLSTDDLVVCDQHNHQAASYCVVAGAGLSIPVGVTIRAYGSKPLVLLSTTTLDLSGTLDASSTSVVAAHPTGPGVPALAACNEGAIAADANSGGFGASFGGKGGNGQIDTGAQPTSGATIAFPKLLRAGCPGGAGSTTPGATIPGVGGSGGGAVAVIANEIDLNGIINASGAGGFGGPAVKSGGGGGGSGGMIVLDAPSIVSGLAFQLFANGGGGGQGGASNSGGSGGGAGLDGGQSRGAFIPGNGGNNAGTVGGGGGTGGGGVRKDGSNAASESLAANAGGGGGGGGVGFIHAPGVVTGTSISPPSTDP